MPHFTPAVGPYVKHVSSLGHCQKRRRPMPRLTYSLLVLLAFVLITSLAGCASNPPLQINDHPLNLKGLSYRQAAIVSTAHKMLGVPYRWGGNTPGGGLDCSGLADLSYRSAGLSLPRTSNEQYHAVRRVKVAQPGDLLFFGHGSTATHVGIYLGRNLMIHAPGRGRTVEYAHLNYPYWKEHFIGAGSLTH